MESFMEASKENRKTKIRWTLWLLLTTLCLGGCSLITRRSEQRREMLEIAESKKMKVAIENMLTKLDSKALTPEGKIKSYKISKDDLDYNPMGGLMIKIIINDNENLLLSTTIQEDSVTGKYEETYYGKTKELNDLLKGN